MYIFVKELKLKYKEGRHHSVLHGQINSWLNKIGPAGQGDACLPVSKQCVHMCRHCVKTALLCDIYFITAGAYFY